MTLTKVTYAMIDGEVINVRDYGAVGDGITDDGPAIRAAVAALSSNQTLYFPDGKYYAGPVNTTIDNSAGGGGASETYLTVCAFQDLQDIGLYMTDGAYIYDPTVTPVNPNLVWQVFSFFRCKNITLKVNFLGNLVLTDGMISNPLEEYGAEVIFLNESVKNVMAEGIFKLCRAAVYATGYDASNTFYSATAKPFNIQSYIVAEEVKYGVRYAACNGTITNISGSNSKRLYRIDAGEGHIANVDVNYNGALSWGIDRAVIYTQSGGAEKLANVHITANITGDNGGVWLRQLNPSVGGGVINYVLNLNYDGLGTAFNLVTDGNNLTNYASVYQNISISGNISTSRLYPIRIAPSPNDNLNDTTVVRRLKFHDLVIRNVGATLREFVRFERLGSAALSFYDLSFDNVTLVGEQASSGEGDLIIRQAYTPKIRNLTNKCVGTGFANTEKVQFIDCQFSGDAANQGITYEQCEKAVFSGEVFLGVTDTSTVTTSGTFIQGQNGFIVQARSGTGSENMTVFRRNGNVVGSISADGSSTSYNLSSDYRLKENLQDVANATERLNRLKVYRFNFTTMPEKTVEGFLAHEVAEIVPEAIQGKKNQIDEDGNPVYQQMDQSKLVPLLVAALQDAFVRIETLEKGIQNDS